MSRRRRTSNAAKSVPVTTPWYKRAWVVVTGLGVIVAAILMNGPTMLENLQKLPGTAKATWSQFMSWRGEDKAWTGIWSSSAEGYVDSADMNLSEVHLRLEITVTEGQLDGTIATKSICKAVPFSFILLEGTTSGQRADVRVFDIIGGKRREFAHLDLRRDGSVMVVAARTDYLSLFPKESRIAR